MVPSFSFARLATRVLSGATEIREDESRSVAAAAGLFFLVLTVVMLLRPVREALALAHGIENVRGLFLCTVAATVLLAPVFGILVSLVSRRKFLAVSFRVCGLMLVGFSLALTWLPDSQQRGVGAVYYVFHSVFNLFVVSLFWGFMADLFRPAQSKRLFPAIALGGTLGAVTGSLVTGQFACQIGNARLFLLAAVLLEGAVWTARLVARSRPDGESTAERRPIGGHALAGLTALVRSPYLLGIAAMIVLTAVASTFLYFTELRIVEATTTSVEERTALFANINVWAQFATLLAQAFVAGRVVRILGVGVALALLPAVAVIGLAVLATWPTLIVLIATVALFKAVHRGVTRPARETLFTVVPREQKYKAKSVTDTFAFRLGDASGAQLERLLMCWGIGAAGLATAVLPIAAVWTVLCLVLGGAQSRLAAATPTDPPTPRESASGSSP